MSGEVDRLLAGWVMRKFWAKQITDQQSDEWHIKAYGFHVVGAEAEYECYCYSDWTRDDAETLFVTFQCNHCDRRIRFEYGRLYDMPQMIQELVEYANKPSDVCPYEDGD